MPIAALVEQTMIEAINRGRSAQGNPLTFSPSGRSGRHSGAKASGEREKMIAMPG